MTSRTQSDTEETLYRAYDDRLISRGAIKEAIELVAARERRRARLEEVRTWALFALLVVVLLGTSTALIWWHLAHP